MQENLPMAATQGRKTTRIRPNTARLPRAFRAKSRGDVFFDAFNRGRYATDASFYQIMPAGVVVPRTIDEALGALAICRDEGFIVTPRGGGTSQCGQTVNDGIVIDLSKHLNRIVSLDVENRSCVVEPGIVLDDLNRQLKKHGLWFPVDVSTASRATIGGMAGNNSCGGRSLRYGTMRDNTLSMDAALADGTLLHFGEVPRDLAQVNSPRWRARPVSRHARARRARSRRDRRKISKGAAPGRRLQSRCAGAAQCAEQHGASAGGIGRDAGLHHPGRAEAVAGDPQQGARRLPLRQFLRGDGCRPASGEAAADRGGAGRSHHALARPRDRDVPADHRDRRARRSRCGADRGVCRGRSGRKFSTPEAAWRADGRSRLWLGPSKRKWGGVVEIMEPALADRDRRVSRRRPQRHDVDEAGGQAGLVRRGLRGAAAASRRLYRTAQRASSPNTAPAAPCTRTPPKAACMCARC